MKDRTEYEAEIENLHAEISRLRKNLTAACSDYSKIKQENAEQKQALILLTKELKKAEAGLIG